jgi:hypothetical protein
VKQPTVTSPVQAPLYRDVISGGLFAGDAVSPATLKKIFWAKLISYGGSGRYAWKEQQLSSIPGVFSDLPGGRYGTATHNPALEANGITFATLPVYVLLQLGYFDPALDWTYMIIGTLASGTGGTGSGTAAVPLRVTSNSAGAFGLWPAVIENYAVNAFSDSGTQIWAVTTQLNDLVANAKYTGILVGHGGSPALDIYCVNDNLEVLRSDGTQALAGINQLVLDPPCAWNISIGTRPGQAVINRLLTVTTSSPGSNIHQQLSNVSSLVFLPKCAWVIDIDSSNPGCGISVERLLDVGTDAGIASSDVAKILFTPYYTWNVTGGACSVNASRLLYVTGADASGNIVNTPPDTYIFNFSITDFIVTQPFKGAVNINTRGLTTNICYCDQDGSQHTMVFVDGLLQAVLSTPTGCQTY